MSEAALLAEVRRGPIGEVMVRGHVAATDGRGHLVAVAGDPEVVTTLRSCVKPLQAVPFVASGACESLGCGEDELALACASHQGEQVHVDTARRLLGRAGLDDSALSCGPQLPYSEEAARQLHRAGEEPGRIHNNCSGKHAAMLATCVHVGWPVAGYAAAEHPLQRAIAAVYSAATGVDFDVLPHAVDGCGLPTYGVPLRLLAKAFCAAAHDSGAFRRCQQAMAAHPQMVGGTGRFDSDLLAQHGERLTAKVGGAAIWVAVLRDGTLGVAVKLEAGAGTHLPPIALAVLLQLGMIDDDLSEPLRIHAAGEVRNWAGEVVGGTSAQVALRSA